MVTADDILTAIRHTPDWNVVALYCEQNRATVLWSLRRRSRLAAEIVDLTSFKTLLQIVDAYPGQALTVPATVNERSALATIIGVEAARTLVDHFGFGPIKTPAQATVLGALWRPIIGDMHRDGRSHNDICRLLQISSRTLSRYLNDPVAPRATAHA